MDVDFLIIVFPDGTKKEYFLNGGITFNMEYEVDSSGNLQWKPPPPLVIIGSFLDSEPITVPLPQPHVPFTPWLSPNQRGWISDAKKRPLPKDGIPK